MLLLPAVSYAVTRKIIVLFWYLVSLVLIVIVWPVVSEIIPSERILKLEASSISYFGLKYFGPLSSVASPELPLSLSITVNSTSPFIYEPLSSVPLLSLNFFAVAGFVIVIVGASTS